MIDHEFSKIVPRFIQRRGCHVLFCPLLSKLARIAYAICLSKLLSVIACAPRHTLFEERGEICMCFLVLLCLDKPCEGLLTKLFNELIQDVVIGEGLSPMVSEKRKGLQILSRDIQQITLDILKD